MGGASFQPLYRTSMIFLTTAAVIIIMAGMMAAKTILVPFLFAVFIAVVFASPMFWLQEKGCPQGLAFGLVVLLIFLGGVALAGLIGASVQGFSDNVPTYEAQFRQQMVNIDEKLVEWGFETAQVSLSKMLNVGSVMKFTSRMLNGVGNALANGLLIFIIATFILLEASSFPLKIKRISKSHNALLEPYHKFVQGVRHYIGIKTLVSFITGVLAYIVVLWVGLDYPVLWGLVAFLLNYIPNIGSVIASVPPIILAMVQYSWHQAIVILIGYVLINFVMANVVEPRWMGKGLGLSTLVVFMSLIFWGWILGPMGMVLSIPLTMTIKVALEAQDETRWAAILLGD